MHSKNPSMDFLNDCRIAAQFCMRKAALRGSLLVGKKEKPFPEPARKKSIRACYFWARKK
jgi:hypothetical protein